MAYQIIIARDIYNNPSAQPEPGFTVQSLEEIGVASASGLPAEGGVIETPDDGGTLIHVKPVGDGRCTARFWHGPGHQSSTRCDVIGLHDVHRCTYGESDADAAWRDGGYTGQLRAKGIKFNPRSYPENMGMSGYFDEPTEDL